MNTVKVKDLIDFLLDCHPDQLVFLKDDGILVCDTEEEAIEEIRKMREHRDERDL